MAQTSALAKGLWTKVAVKKQGIFKITGAQLKSLGFSLPINSTQLQLFGFNQNLLNEKVTTNPTMGLVENAVKVNDGGDGQIDELDHILFYAEGPVQWYHDTQNGSKRFNHLASDSVFYFLTIGSNGKRIGAQNLPRNVNYLNREMFTQHFLYEKDSISLLNSGKVFWGAPMGIGQGKISQLNYLFNANGMNNQSWVKTFAHLASTSYAAGAQFDFYWNDIFAHSTQLQPVSGLLFDDIAKEVVDSFTNANTQGWQSKSNLKVAYNSSNATATGYIDYVELLANKPIGFWQDSVLSFAIEKDFQKGQLVNCKVQDIDASAIIWNITNVENPVQVNWQLEANNTGSFIQQTDSTADFIGVKQNAFESPILMGIIPNQDILNITGEINYVIVTAPAFIGQAKKYQQFEQTTFGRKTVVVNVRELYNEFSGGQASPIAIRNFLKYLSNRASQNNFNSPAYLLLLGMGNFNPKKMNLAYELPVYENNNSTSILSSFSSDDFYAILNDADDINNYNAVKGLSLAVGRIPARTIADADSSIFKLMNYQLHKNGGAWENKITWIADDGDYNLHLQDAEYIMSRLQNKARHWDHNKIYLDLFAAESTTSGNVYPFANNALQQAVQDGTLLINYTGHGNYLRLAEEGVISQTQFDSWDNKDKLPLLVTASCNFAPYDQPNVSPIAWDAFMKNGKGVIGLVAANRLVFAFSNKQINDLFIQQLLVDDADGNRPSVGQALQRAKNINWTLGGDRMNDFKFSVIGDPALVLNMPNHQLSVSSIGGKMFTGVDTLTAGNTYKINGLVKKAGVVKTDFNGVLSLIIYDALKYKNTLANQSTSMVVPIGVQENILFKGNSTIKNGEFNADFILPIQVSNTTSPIRFELAASSNDNTAIQVLDAIYVKSNQLFANKDTIGPLINAYLNDPYFKQGTWASPNSVLHIQLKDSSGIQTSGNALGQDLALWLDKNPIPITLNNYFISDLDTYKSGTVTFAIPTLSEGKHTLVIKAWDLLGNGSKDSLIFEVPKSKSAAFKNPTNFPNPFKLQTNFSFETNQIGKKIDVLLSVFTQDGQIVYSNTSSFLNNQAQYYFNWDGRSNMGAIIPPGVYYYRFLINVNGETAILSNSFIKL
jgi:hypothetical protein